MQTEKVLKNQKFIDIVVLSDADSVIRFLLLTNVNAFCLLFSFIYF